MSRRTRVEAKIIVGFRAAELDGLPERVEIQQTDKSTAADVLKFRDAKRGKNPPSRRFEARRAGGKGSFSVLEIFFDVYGSAA